MEKAGSGKVLRVLIADDDEGDRKQLRRAIRQSGLEAECTETASIEEALAAAEEAPFDAAILDYRLPGRSGLEGIDAFRERFPQLPILMSTGQGDERVATEAMKRGASDYLRKADVDAESIRRAIENVVEKAALRRKVVEQREELENFARVLVHDLRSPAASILGIARLIPERIAEGNLQDAALYSEWVAQSAMRMNRLIDTLRQYTRADAQVEFEATPMEGVLADTRAALDQLLRETGAVLTADPLPPVWGNAPMLTQLLQNLIGNGIKYCEEPVARIHVSAVKKLGDAGEWTGEWLFSVQDNGIGIPERHYRLVFEPFKRMNGADKCDGTGLGLATCRKIVERHGGAIWCQSAEGRGSTFFFTLPASAPDRAVVAESGPEKAMMADSI